MSSEPTEEIGPDVARGRVTYLPRLGGRRSARRRARAGIRVEES